MGAVKMSPTQLTKKTPVHQLMSWEMKSCVFIFLTSNRCFWTKYESMILNNIPIFPVVLSHQNPLFRTVFACKQYLICAYFSPDSEKTTFSLKKERMDRGLVYFDQKQWVEVKNVVLLIVFLQTCSFLCIIVMFLLPVWTLILTAPIHCRASGAMLNLSKSFFFSMKKQTVG